MGKIVKWCGTNTDIEDRKRAEEALRRSEQSFRLIVDSIPGLVATRTSEGKAEFENQQTPEYFGKTLGELESWAANDVVHPDDLPHVIAAYTSGIETGTPYESEHRLRCADGAYRWFHSRGLPAARDREGRIIRWYFLRADIDKRSKRKRAEEELRRSEAYLSEAQRFSHTGSFGWNVPAARSTGRARSPVRFQRGMASRHRRLLYVSRSQTPRAIVTLPASGLLLKLASACHPVAYRRGN